MCSSPLTEQREPAPQWRCAAGHAFDVAREGYVNLLVTHQRRRREPGDSAAMVHARRAFLDRGHYQPLRDALAHAAGAFPSTATGPAPVVCDAGCGEGYYTRGWPDVWGVDIAKVAVRLAARRAQVEGRTGARYAVASAYDLPLPDASVDVVVSVFAPLHSPEFERVLRAGGMVVTVTPGPDHLAGLAAELFEVVEAHPDRGPFDGGGATTSLVAVGRDRIRYDLHLDASADVAALLTMTPYAWYVDEATRLRVGANPALSTPVDFLISVYRLP